MSAMTSPLRLLGLSTFVSISALCGCGPDGSTLPPDPPQATLTAESSNVADTKIRLRLSIHGCDNVESATLVDGETLVKNVPYAGNPTDFEVLSNEVSYKSGIAAQLSFRVLVTCADGRTLKSQPTSVQFLPVASSVLGADGGQALPDIFYARGPTRDARFVGCVGQSNGASALAEVNSQGAVTAVQNDLPIPCTQAARFTDKNPVSGKRWLWQVNGGAFAFDDALNTYGAVTSINPGRVAVGPDGNAVLFSGAYPEIGLSKHRHTDGAMLWSRSMPEVIGDPVVQSNGRLMVPEFLLNLGDERAYINIEAIDYGNGNTLNSYTLFEMAFTGIERPFVPPAAFNADATQVYIPVESAPGSSFINACVSAPSTATAWCTGTNRKWKSANVSSRIVALVPFANNSKLAAIGPQKTFFLDAATGAVLNGANPIVTTGALVTQWIQVGKARDLYLLNGASSGGSPLEIIAVDTPETGEVFRFQTGTGRVMAGTDDEGQVWMGVGKQLVKPLSLTQYRAAREQ